jgi:uncharacterized protein YjbI with pentapeptide repeats
MTQASLIWTNLAEADLTGAKLDSHWQSTVESLKGAILPDGTRHP